MSADPLPAALAARLPDVPDLIDLRGLLLSGRCRVFPEHPEPGEGFIARSLDFPYAAAHGTPSPETVRAAVRGAESDSEWHLLAPPEAADAVHGALRSDPERDWKRRGVVLHSLAGDPPAAGDDPGDSGDAGTEIRLLPEGHGAAGLDLGHLPDALRREYSGEWVATRPLVAAVVDGRAVAFCYAPLLTEGLWDVAVDTLTGHRRRGLAAACFRRLAAHLWSERGLAPVWGALSENTASMALAARLGFRPVAGLVSVFWTSG